MQTINQRLLDDDVIFGTPPDRAVLWYPGLPGGGTKIYDRSIKRANNGTITGALWTRLPSGLWVLDYDGTDDKVTFATPYPISTLLNGATGIVLMAWINNDTLPANPNIYYVLAGEVDGASHGYQVGIRNTAGVYTMRVGGRSVAGDAIQGNDDIAFAGTGAWRFVACILDFTNDQLTAVLDGTVDTNTVTFGNNTYTLGTPTNGDRIGCTPAETALNFFDGKLGLIGAKPKTQTLAVELALLENFRQQTKHSFGV